MNNKLEKDGVPPLATPQLDYLMFRLRENSDRKELYVVSQNITYASNPEEAFTILSRIAAIAEELGFDMTNDSEIASFFIKNQHSVLKESKKHDYDLDHDFYKYIFEVAKSKKPGDDQVFADLMTYVTTLI